MAKPASLTMHDADARVCAEEAGVFPRASASSDMIVEEVPNFVAGVDRIDAWMEVAKVGDRFVYASRVTLPRSSAGIARMRDLAARGLVNLCQRRSTVDRTFSNYIAQRTSVPTALTKPQRRLLSVAVEPIADGEAAVIDAMLPVLERFARHGRPCPTDRQLADKANLTEDAVKAGLKAMVAANLIRVNGCAAPTYRRIIILASGLITGIAA